MEKTTPTKKVSRVFVVVKPYALLISGLFLFTVLSNGLNLVIPSIISGAIDTYTKGSLNLNFTIWEFFGVSALIFIFAYLQNIMQTYASEKVAKDLRKQLIGRISEQDYNYVQTVTPGRLLTNLTSDMDNIKMFVSMAIPAIISSVFLIVGASILLLMINWKLALGVLMVIPIITVAFSFIFARVGPLFQSAQETVDWLNRIINESILGSTLVRLLNSQMSEYQKFLEANQKSNDVGMSILRLFSMLIPIVSFSANLATLVILLL